METNNPPVQPVNTQPTPPRRNWFDAMHIITYVVVLVGLGLIGWQIYAYVNTPKETTNTQTTQTPDVTANWKTYTNTRVGYQFDYPSSETIDESIKYPSTVAPKRDLVQFGTATATYGVQTEISVNSSTIEAWIGDTNQSHTSGKLTDFMKLTLDGRTAYRNKNYLVTYVMNGKNVYMIDSHVDIAPSTNMTDPIYSQMILTFKFTDSVSMADWKTYTNSRLGFVLKYPEELSIRQFNDFGTEETVTSTGESIGLKQGSDYIFTVRTLGDITLTNQIIAQEFSNSKPTDYTITSTTIAGNSGKKVVFNTNVQGVVSDFYYIESSGKVFVISVAKNNSTAVQVLSTFKFTDVKASSDKIFSEVSSQLAFTRSQVVYFRIFGSDRVQYSLGGGTTFAYKYNGKWQIAGPKSAQDVRSCTEYSSVPEQYRPMCDDSTGQLKYADAQRMSINYPSSQRVSYIGE